MDEWGVDIAVTGSQKGFMLPTGLAIVGVSPKALAAMETAKLPRCFLDFRDMLTANPKGGFPYTPPVNLFYGLGEVAEDDRGGGAGERLRPPPPARRGHPPRRRRLGA